MLEEANQILRNRATMVIFAIEQALGNFVKTKHASAPAADSDPTIADVLARTGANADSNTTLPRSKRVAKAVSESFLDELLRIATALTAGTSFEEPLCKLRELIHAVGLLEVRNAVAHPNRQFPDNYWYRCALVATSLPVNQLALVEVHQAFQSALADKIVLPPDDWFAADAASVPSNLPRQTDHDATGLLGRNREKQDLLKILRGRRHPMIVITGPGGLGKTALAIQVLRDYSQDYSTAPAHSCIVYASLKQENLTVSGVTAVTTAQSIEELQQELLETVLSLIPAINPDNFAELCTALSDEPLLLFVDNLETILRDSPDSFIKFVDTLPREWTVLATSRIAVDGARAVPLSQLAPRDAENLAFRYSDSKGLELTPDAATAIAQASQFNPLALRLSIDQIANGAPLDAATRKASQDVVKFSFHNLIGRLTPHAKNVLECLFVRSPMSRGEIVAALGLGPDDAVEAARSLARTSLVTRIVDNEDELFELNPSIRDLLRETPLDLDARSRISKKLDKERRALQVHRSILRLQSVSEFSESYLPDDISPAVGGPLTKAIRFLKSNEKGYQKANNLLKELNSLVYSNPSNWRLFVQMGRLSERLQDDSCAEDYYHRAIRCSNGHITPSLRLVEFYLKLHRSADALPRTTALIAEGFGDPGKSEENTACRVWQAHFRAALEESRNELVNNELLAQFGNERLNNLFQAMKAEAIIRSVSGIHTSDGKRAAAGLLEAMDKLQAISKIGAYPSKLARNVVLLCKEVTHMRAASFASENEMFYTRLVGGLANIILDDNLSQEALGYIANLVELLRSSRDAKTLELISTPFWDKFLKRPKTNALTRESLLRNGYVIARVVKIARTDPDEIAEYCFAKDEAGSEYFVHRDNLVEGEVVGWNRLKVGSLLALNMIEEPPRGRLPVPQEVLLL